MERIARSAVFFFPAGDRRMHAINSLTDWMLMGPTGTINPSDTRPVRTARRGSEKILKLIAQTPKQKPA